ncbi:7055_t:CDS:2 [Cetraspora pellucida]|uniref:7055_t:CDS:1 n=1 Tax=Cetraspora pellucida TaxID=1433469 RepID=A0ACA9NPB2_9GLOM|nr:7055_t:CDS:2 [Cetraspora pellucida]
MLRLFLRIATISCSTVKTRFLDPQDNNCAFKSLEDEYQLKEVVAKSKENMMKTKLLAIINSLLNSINTSNRLTYRDL